MTPGHIFTGNPLDRSSGHRIDEAWLAAQAGHPSARFLAMRALHASVRPGDLPRLAWLGRDAVEALRADGDAVLLGLEEDIPHFAVSVPGDAEALDGIEFAEARVLGAILPTHEAGILAQARSMLDWHTRHRFCTECGGPTVAAEGGARRHCTVCGAHAYPQVSPSIIVLVEREGRCLLAKRSAGATNRYSCVAGYVEPGESIEEAVAREVMEEVGVRVDGVRYHSSQPWPFPATLMIGCTAIATTEDIHVDEYEIGEAHWFTRDEVRSALARTNPALTVPEPVAIAHHLIKDWVEQVAPVGA
jgi:NAD+ diphosphatase